MEETIKSYQEKSYRLQLVKINLGKTVTKINNKEAYITDHMFKVVENRRIVYTTYFPQDATKKFIGRILSQATQTSIL